MIKIIAFDLIGVLLGEKNIELSSDEDKLERLFGPNISDSEYIEKGHEIIGKDRDIVRITKKIISKLYRVRQEDVFKTIKDRYKDIKIIIASNHVSYVRKYIEEVFDKEYLDDIIISAEINRIKPNRDFYQYILDKYDIKAHELLFLDDSKVNVDGAKELGINTIKVDRDMDISKAAIDYIDNKRLFLSNLECVSNNIDIKKYIMFREDVKRYMEHPEWLGDFSYEEIEYLLDNNSKIWMYYLEDVPVCSMMLIPARDKDLKKFGIDLNYKEVADYGPMFVNYNYIGNGLQYQMLKVLDKYCYSMGYKYAASTIHPDNLYSINNLIKDGFEYVNAKAFTRGPRNIYLKKLKKD